MKPVDCPVWKGSVPTEDAIMIEDSDVNLSLEDLVQECRYWDTITSHSGEEVFWIVLHSSPEVVVPHSQASLSKFLKEFREEKMKIAV